MRIVTFLHRNQPTVGLIKGDAITPLPGMSIFDLISAGTGSLTELSKLKHATVPLKDAKLLAPIHAPRRNIMCLGKNYAEHAKEMSQDGQGKPPEFPMFFSKATTTINAPYGDIPFDAKVSTAIDWEAELAVIIGKRGKNISQAEAMNHVFGYTVINDVTARDMQKNHGQFFKGKSLDGCCPMGPWIVTADEIPDPHNLYVRCRVNGVTKQDGHTKDLIYKIPVILESLSRGMTLEPGDVIATGTPSGVGAGRTPPEWLKPGDVVECEVEGIGTIRNRVANSG
jgi:2-keto-4-pentenoate hydratase/2-oxohepta-3-ene-1,7-dioic acid hydratase in catechol pathway